MYGGQHDHARMQGVLLTSELTLPTPIQTHMIMLKSFFLSNPVFKYHDAHCSLMLWLSLSVMQRTLALAEEGSQGGYADASKWVGQSQLKPKT